MNCLISKLSEMIKQTVVDKRSDDKDVTVYVSAFGEE